MEDRFRPGTWQLDCWLESQLGSTRDIPGAHMKDTVRLKPDDASWPPATVFFNFFYHGVRFADGDEVRFENGSVQGRYKQRGVDDIPATVVTITGNYAPDSFQICFESPVFGLNTRQMVEGRLVEQA